MLKDKTAYILFLSIALNFVMHYKILDLDIQGVHTWRQSQTMWNIRNFYRHDANILNPRVSHFNGGKDNTYRFEFPIMQWTIAMLEKIFGEKIIVVRLSIFVIGLFSILFFYSFLKLLGFSKFASVGGTILFQFSPVFYYYTVNPIPDNLALMGTLAYLFFIFKYFKTAKIRELILASLFLAISTSAKLPFLMFSIVSIVFFISELLNKNRNNRQLFSFFTIHLIFLLPVFAWYIWVIPEWSGNPVLKGIFDSSTTLSNILRIANFHISTMFPLVLLSPAAWLFFIIGIFKFKHIKEYKLYGKYIKAIVIITFLYLFLEFNTIRTVHDYYMMPFLPWLYILVAVGIEYLIKSKYIAVKLITAIMLILSPFSAYYLTRDHWSIEKAYFNPDLFKYKKELKNAIPQNEQCIIMNDFSRFVFSYQIDKMGHIFSNDDLPIDWIDDMIKRFHIKYMYSDSRKIDTCAAFQPYIDTLLLQAGSIKVFKLKGKTTSKQVKRRISEK